MKITSINPFLSRLFLAAACFTSAVHAASGTWNDITGGLWSDTGNWNSGTVADGNTFNANFNTLDITADTTVSLDSARTLSSLTFGDTTTSSAAGWILDNNGNAANILTLGSTPTITVNALGTGKNVTISAELAGTLGMTKAGAGTLVLTAANSYTGTTTISGGTLALSGGNNRLTTDGTVNFSAAGTLNLGSTEQTLANLTAGNNITGTVTGTTGGKLTLTGSLFALGATVQNQTQILNLSGLPTFEYNNAAGTFRVSGAMDTNGQSGSSGVLTLASTSNTITALSFGLGNRNGSLNGSVNSGTVNLGTTNTINSDTITIGGNRGAGTLQYLTGANTPTLTLRGTAGGTSRVTSMILSDQGGPNTSGTVQGLVDLTSNVTGTSTLDARITTLTIGKNWRNSGAGGNTLINTGTFTMGAGTLDATTIYLAQNTAGFTNGGTTSKTTGNLTVGAGGTIKVNNFYFADQNTSGSTGSALEANFNLNGGANLYAANIAKGAGTGTHTATRTFNWNDGTIRNYDSSTNLTFDSGITVKLAATGTHAFNIDSNRTGTVDSVLSDATTLGTLTKAGDGTLTLTGSNTYTGTTTVQQGTLALGLSGTISSSLVLGVSGGTVGSLDVTAKASFSQANVSGSGTLNIGAGKTISVTTALGPGFSPGTINVTGNLSLVNGTDNTITTMELAGLGGVAGVDSDFVNVTGTFTLDGILNIVSYNGYDLAQAGTYNLFDAAGGFSGNFDDVNVGSLTNLTRSGNVWSTSDGGLDYSFDETNGVLTVIPEPAAALLGSLGLLVLLRRRRN